MITEQYILYGWSVLGTLFMFPYLMEQGISFQPTWKQNAFVALLCGPVVWACAFVFFVSYQLWKPLHRFWLKLGK